MLLIPENYWQLNVVQPTSSLINTINSSLTGNFAKGLVLESVMVVNQITFVAGELDLALIRLNDGTTVQQELLFINGSWINLGMNIAQMGSEAPPSPPNNNNQNKQCGCSPSSNNQNSPNSSSSNRQSNISPK